MNLAAEPHLLEDVERFVGDVTLRKLLVLPRRVHQRDAQVIEYRHAGKRFGNLKAARQSEPRPAVRRFLADIASFETDAAFFVTQRSRNAVDERALARTVGPDEAEALARPHDEIDLVERGEAAEALGDARDFEQRFVRRVRH